MLKAPLRKLEPDKKTGGLRHSSSGRVRSFFLSM